MEIFGNTDQEVIRNKLGVFLAKLKEEGHTQTSIATRLGRTQGAISHMKQGITPIAIPFIIELAQEYREPLSNLLPAHFVNNPHSTAAEAKFFYFCFVYAQNRKQTLIPDFLKYGITNNPTHRIGRLQDKSGIYNHEYAAVFEFSRPYIAAAIEGRFHQISAQSGEYISMSFDEAKVLVMEICSVLNVKPNIDEPTQKDKPKLLH